MRITSAIDRLPIKDHAKTILETDDGDTIALFTDRSNYVPVGRTKLRINGDVESEIELPIEALRDIANALRQHAAHLDATAGHPSINSSEASS